MKKLLRVCTVAALCSLSFLTLPALHAQVPQIINYQGRVAVGTTNFNGSGAFKFALVNAAGTTTYWSNDGTSIAGSQPTAAVSLTVTKGLYSVLLGDTALPGMTAIPNTVFANADVRLRVWFNDGTTGSQLLTPDQRLAAVGYAMVAGSVPDGSITSAKIATGAVTNTQLATNAVQAANIAAGAVGSAQIGTGAVGSSQIAAGAVTNTQMAAGAITGANLATQARSGTLFDGLLNATTPGSVSLPILYSPALNANPTLSQTPGGWTFSAASTTGFTATAPFAPQTLDSTGNVGALTSLKVTAAGRPAIAYFDTTNSQLKYAVAPNADGSGTWTVVTIGPAVNSIQLSLAIIAGVPCIAYRSGSALAFARSSTAAGGSASDWSVTTADSSAGSGYISLAEVAGRPAIGWRGSGLRYTIAANADGSGGWTPVTVQSGTVGNWTSLAVVNGNPAISYWDNTNNVLKFARANDATGCHLGDTAHDRWHYRRRNLHLPHSRGWQSGGQLQPSLISGAEIHPRQRRERHGMGRTRGR